MQWLQPPWTRRTTIIGIRFIALHPSGFVVVLTVFRTYSVSYTVQELDETEIEESRRRRREASSRDDDEYASSCSTSCGFSRVLCYVD